MASVRERDERTSIRGMRGLWATLALTSAVACSSATNPALPPPPPPPPPGGVQLTTTTVASGLSAPLYLTTPAGDPRLFIVEQTGRIRIVDAGGQLLATPFLDLTGQVDNTSEGGLLNLAFHPQYASNGFAYVNYTDPGGDTRVERYTVSADPNALEPASAKPIIEIDQPRTNHNGGQLQFGPDGMLYVFLGDGGGGGDPDDDAQDPGTLLGSILRLDVDGGDPFAIPTDNPFVGGGGRDEIWAYGVRNPWRSSFDPTGGFLYVADVGQGTVEEVNAVPLDRAGVNYGWDTMEGSTCFEPSTNCDMTGLTLPVEEYENTGANCSVTGGYVYRGSAIPEIQGHYFYSDFCGGFLRSFRVVSEGSITDRTTWNIGNLGNVSSFGVDGAGELYVIDLGGTVSRIEAQP
ncbi:MAG: PQQ-dependent sugar dehydrogenase [Gemmatimonadetes bacterium]|nr:PQQ-dependent sugar dehydrogenase [Gemmatimonadota bacterium]